MYTIRNNLLLRRNVQECLIGCIACHVLPALKPPEVGGGVVSVRRPGDGFFFMLTKGLLGLFHLGGSGGTRRGRRVGASVGNEKKENLEFDVC